MEKKIEDSTISGKKSNCDFSVIVIKKKKAPGWLCSFVVMHNLAKKFVIYINMTIK